jgi:GT2 family glycosyltransferase
MHVAVAIVGFRNLDDIQRCLRGLALSTYADFEVVICENGGPDAFAKLTAGVPSTLAEGQRVTCILAAGNLGYAGGVNVCLAHTPEADAWWVLNPDTAPDPAALAAMVAKLVDGAWDAVGCTLRLPNGGVQSYGGHWSPWLGRAVSMGRGSAWDAPVDEASIEREQNYLNGASMLVGARFLSVVGPMREDYFLYCEEIEWCLRAIAKGMRLGFASQAVVMHYEGTATGSKTGARLPVYMGERNKILMTRDLGPERLPVVILAAVLICVIRFARRRAWRQIGYGLSGWMDGILNRRGPPAWLGV